jgi:hypothetical protein
MMMMMLPAEESTDMFPVRVLAAAQCLDRVVGAAVKVAVALELDAMAEMEAEIRRADAADEATLAERRHRRSWMQRWRTTLAAVTTHRPQNLLTSKLHPLLKHRHLRRLRLRPRPTIST